MKVICVDNFDREWISDSLIAENLSSFDASAKAKELNKKDNDPHTPCYYRAVEDDYELYEFEP